MPRLKFFTDMHVEGKQHIWKIMSDQSFQKLSVQCGKRGATELFQHFPIMLTYPKELFSNHNANLWAFKKKRKEGYDIQCLRALKSPTYWSSCFYIYSFLPIYSMLHVWVFNFHVCLCTSCVECPWRSSEKSIKCSNLTRLTLLPLE